MTRSEAEETKTVDSGAERAQGVEGQRGWGGFEERGYTLDLAPNMTLPHLPLSVPSSCTWPPCYRSRS